MCYLSWAMRKKVKYWNDVQIEDGLCFKWNGESQVISFNEANVGFFHTWGIVSGETVAIIENYNGNIETINPTFVKFTRENSDLSDVYKALAFLEDAELMERVVQIFLNTHEYN